MTTEKKPIEIEKPRRGSVGRTVPRAGPFSKLLQAEVPLKPDGSGVQSRGSSRFLALGSVSHVGRESEGQPLRHFFDDWPRASRDQSAMTWGSSGVDESERSNSDNNNNNLTINTHHGAPNNNNNNNTQLSISIPITASSSAALSAQHSGSPPAGCR
jgi:hypothetical protein